jgi:hypothetical protein
MKHGISGVANRGWTSAKLPMVALVAGLLPLGTVAAQSPQLAEVHAADDLQGAVQEARALIHEIMEAQGVPGASVAVGVSGERLCGPRVSAGPTWSSRSP